ncbi:MAG: STM4012 family radical SAM protein, partial [Phycisphaerae bacterium]|nr:STM4012 family radical SAM protein [Phycisphaerae bacterium]
MTTSSALSILAASPYSGYAYAYPHKTAYRPLCPPVPLSDVWQTEPRDALFCYVHIPFCEMRCGFCNLLTAARPPAAMVNAYLDSLQRQADAVMSAVAGASFARFAVGGGTPTYLSSAQLQRLLSLLRGVGIDPQQVPGSVETSPATVTRERLAVLRDAGVARISIGVQTFCEQESRKLGRRQSRHLVETAVHAIAATGFPCVNIDLMYGGEDQTLLSWTQTVQQAIDANPDEVYLYPLYVRPMTGLWKQRHQWDDQRMTAYRAARDLLRERDFEQLSMRMFRRSPAGDQAEPEYCCQRDGMIGLGCGARSYTRSLHYATEYAVGRAGVLGLIDAYIATSDAEFARVSHGIRLNRDEQVRRFVIKSLLRAPGIDRRLYREAFETDVLEDLPQLGELVDAGWAEARDSRIVLTAA